MKNLTLRYSITHCTYWAAYASASFYAATYLLNRGLPSGYIGILLALAGLLSCLSQPILASFVDRAKGFILKKALILMTALCGSCFVLLLTFDLPLTVAAVLYMVGLWSSDAMIPLLNALSVAYNNAGYPVNYGAARGCGSAAAALSSLVIGHIIAKLGTAWMLLYIITMRVCCLLALAGFPDIPKSTAVRNAQQSSTSILYFFSHYRWYCVSLLGIAFLGMFHAMIENYMIAIMEALGGNSSHVGTALFISSITGAPVIFCFSRIRSRIKDTNLIKIAAVSFLVKAVGFYLAGSITTIYLLQLLQMCTFAFLHPTQVYYAKAKVSATDMVKGQAFITAAYALGCSGGNFAGGQLLVFGADAILIAGICMAAAGALILFGTVNKSDLKASAT